MILWFRQRFFSWFDSYDIYDEAGKTVYVVKGQFSWGHCLKIFDSSGKEVGTVKERVLALMPKFEMYIGDKYVGCIRKKLTFFKSEYTVDCNGWFVKSNFMEWDYKIFNANGQQIATVSKQLFRLTDTYSIDMQNPQDALFALMLVLAIDAEKCSRGDS